MDRELGRSLALLGVVVVITAWFSATFYFPDEHYQVLEFLSYKLGITNAADLPWEFSARIRPWFQPFVYFLIAKPLLLMGVKDLFVLTAILRLATGLFSLLALGCFVQALLPDIDSGAERRAFVGYLPLYGFLPYLFVRTASETFSAAFFALGLALALRTVSFWRLGLAGLLCGLAFESRYQAGFLGLGLFAWLWLIARIGRAGLAGFVLGGLVALVAGAVVDRWGYGQWLFPALAYLDVNLVQGVAARQFGRAPVLAYLYLLPAQIFFAITLVLMAAMVLMWLRNPRHPLSWASFFFVIAHLVVAHKEARFLFPLSIVATAFPVLGFSPRLSAPLSRCEKIFARLWGWRRCLAAKAVTAISLAGMAFFALYPFGVRAHMPMAQYLYRHWQGPIYSFSPPFQSYPMYRPAGFQSRFLKDPADLEALLAKGPVLLMTQTPVPPVLGVAVRTQLLYSEFPLTRFGYGRAGAAFIDGYRRFAARHPFLKLLPLYWYSLYRVARSDRIRR